MLNQLCSVHAVCASIVLNMFAPDGTTFDPCQEFPGDLRASPRTDLGFTLTTPPPKTACMTAAELGTGVRSGLECLLTSLL